MPSLRSFLSLEGTVSGRVNAALAKELRPLTEAIIAACRQERWSTAHEYADKLDSDFLEKFRGIIETTLLQAMLLGASQHSKLGKTYIDKQGPPAEVVHGANWFLTSMREQTLPRLRAAMHAVVEQYRKNVLEGHEHADGDITEDEVKKAAVNPQTVDELAAALNGAVMGGGQRLVDIKANLVTSRAASLGFLVQAAENGAVRYQVSSVLDTRVCPVCRNMHGRTFEVYPAREKVEFQLGLDDPLELSLAAPFPSQSKANVARIQRLTDEKAQAEGLDYPPYHPLCRCVLVEAGTVEPIDEPLLPEVKDRTLFEGETSEHQYRPIKGTNAKGEPIFGEWSAERKKVHEKILDDFLRGEHEKHGRVPEAQAHPEMRMMGGGSGAGKSSVGDPAKGFVSELYGVTIDPDAIKKALPEWDAFAQAGDVRGAAWLHEESSYLAKELSRRAIENKFNIVYDGTGDSGLDGILKKLVGARQAGYRVTAEYVTIDTQDALNRNLKRAISGLAKGEGRMVPNSYVVQIHSNTARDLRDAIARGDIFDEVRLWSNSVPKGQSPILIVEQKFGDTVMHRQDLWDDMLTKIIVPKDQVPTKVVVKPVLPDVPKWIVEGDPFDGAGKQIAKLKDVYQLYDEGLITQGQREALGEWQASIVESREIQDYLRGAKQWSKMQPENQKRLIEMTTMFDTNPKASTLTDDLVLWRGVDGKDLPADLFTTKGYMFTDNAFSSATLDRHVGENFALDFGLTGDTDPVVFRIRAPRGTRAAVLGTTGEAEVLVDRATTYRVVSVEEGVLFPDTPGNAKLRVVTLEIEDQPGGAPIKDALNVLVGAEEESAAVHELVTNSPTYTPLTTDTQFLDLAEDLAVKDTFDAAPSHQGAFHPQELAKAWSYDGPGHQQGLYLDVEERAMFLLRDQPDLRDMVNGILKYYPEVGGNPEGPLQKELLKDAGFRYLKESKISLPPRSTLRTKAVEVIAYLESALEAKSTPMPFDTVAWRGLSKATADGFQEGMVFTDNTYQAWSFGRDKAYINALQGDAKVMMRVIVPKDMQGLYLGGPDYEYLLPRNVSYRVHSVEKGIDILGGGTKVDVVTVELMKKELPPTISRADSTIKAALLGSAEPEVKNPLVYRLEDAAKADPKKAYELPPASGDWPKEELGNRTHYDLQEFSDKAGRSGLTAWKERYGTENAAAIYNYQGSGYVEINGTLRLYGGSAATPYDLDGEKLLEAFTAHVHSESSGHASSAWLNNQVNNVFPKVVEHIDRLDRVINSPEAAAPYDLVTFRGIRGSNPARYNNFAVGSVFTEDGYGSFSAAKSVASGFGGQQSQAVIFRTLIPKGSPGLWLGIGEDEWLMPRGVTYRILSVEENVVLTPGATPRKVVTLEILDYGPVAREGKTAGLLAESTAKTRALQLISTTPEFGATQNNSLGVVLTDSGTDVVEGYTGPKKGTIYAKSSSTGKLKSTLEYAVKGNTIEVQEFVYQPSVTGDAAKLMVAALENLSANYPDLKILPKIAKPGGKTWPDSVLYKFLKAQEAAKEAAQLALKKEEAQAFKVVDVVLTKSKNFPGQGGVATGLGDDGLVQLQFNYASDKKGTLKVWDLITSGEVNTKKAVANALDEVLANLDGPPITKIVSTGGASDLYHQLLQEMVDEYLQAKASTEAILKDLGF